MRGGERSVRAERVAWEIFGRPVEIEMLAMLETRSEPPASTSGRLALPWLWP